MAAQCKSFDFLDELREQKKSKATFPDFIKYLDTKARLKGIPISGQFELTPFCNLNCRMCYVHLNADQAGSDKLLGTGTWKTLFDQALKAGMITAVLTGGECLTYPGFKELYLYLHSKGCQVSILTNGVLLDEEWIRFFKAHPPAVIQITLYGSDEDTYERVTGYRVARLVQDHVKMIKEAGLNLVLNITPSRYLGEDVFHLLDLTKELDIGVNINTSLFTPRQETGRSGVDDDVDIELYARIWRYRQELFGNKPRDIPEESLPEPGGPCHECTERGLKCGGGRSGFVIDWDGTMHPCNRLSFESYPLKDGFEKAWKQINEKAAGFPRVAECNGCPYETVCDICVARMMQYAPPGERPAGHCEKTRYLVKQGVMTIPECE